eukprot:469640-Rhodomonas_salina.1
MEALTRSLEQIREKPSTARDEDSYNVEEIPQGGSGTAAMAERPRKTPRRDVDRVSSIADAFVRAIEERLGDGGGGTGDEPVTETAT